MNITDCLVQNGETEDRVLHAPSFNVNTGLCRTSVVYRGLIWDIIRYMVALLKTTFEPDGVRIAGISGANIGIPLNIVGIRVGDVEPLVLVNPTITTTSEEMANSYERCRSAFTPSMVRVSRPSWVTCRYYNLNGDIWVTQKFCGQEAAVLSHEIDHNQGILITDKE